MDKHHDWIKFGNRYIHVDQIVSCTVIEGGRLLVATAKSVYTIERPGGFTTADVESMLPGSIIRMVEDCDK